MTTDPTQRETVISDLEIHERREPRMQPRVGMTVAEVEASLAERKAEGARSSVEAFYTGRDIAELQAGGHQIFRLPENPCPDDEDLIF
jgi:hypothetical protein